MFRVLDAFCCAGGATRGYQMAGFHVTGVDINPQPNYIGDAFHQGDAVEFIRDHGHEFDFIHASPPCQAYTNAQRIQRNEHPDLIGPTREALAASGVPFVIENVRGAPLNGPVELCMCMFDPDPGTYRERWFEAGGGLILAQPEHRPHAKRLAKMGRAPRPDEAMHVVGHFSGVSQARKAMGIDWTTRGELAEAIPPAYTRHIGTEVMKSLKVAA